MKAAMGGGIEGLGQLGGLGILVSYRRLTREWLSNVWRGHDRLGLQHGLVDPLSVVR
jgi:hypothetical protein